MKLTKNEQALLEKIRNIVNSDLTAEDISEIVELIKHRYIPVAQYSIEANPDEALEEMFGGLQKDIINEPGGETILINFGE